MEKKTKVTFVLPEALQHDVKQQLVKEGYSLKDKSRWISEAIESLFSIENYHHLVKLNDQMRGFEKPESVVIEESLKQRINEAILTIRRQYPELEGVQSRIMRTAIVQRLL